MSVIGVRCSNTDFTFAILDGSKEDPELKAHETRIYPKGFSRAEILDWLCKEFSQLMQSLSVRCVAIKKAEPTVKRSNTLEDRIQCEAVVMLASIRGGSKSIVLKVNASIAKGLGMKGKAKYLKTFDASDIPGFESFSEKKQDAVRVAWSEL